MNEKQILLKAAEEGDIEACVSVAEGYFYGKFEGNADYEKAYYWAEKAKDAKHEKACMILGVLYLNGNAVKKDYELAEKYLTMATEAGDMKAPRYIGQMYAEGLGKVLDWTEAEKWYQLGASRGDITSMYMLGKIYEEGLGVQADLAAAITWYQKSAKREDHVGRPSREALKRLNIPMNENPDSPVIPGRME